MTVGARHGLGVSAHVLSGGSMRIEIQAVLGSLRRIPTSTAAAQAAGSDARGPHSTATEVGVAVGVARTDGGTVGVLAHPTRRISGRRNESRLMLRLRRPRTASSFGLLSTTWGVAADTVRRRSRVLPRLASVNVTARPVVHSSAPAPNGRPDNRDDDRRGEQNPGNVPDEVLADSSGVARKGGDDSLAGKACPERTVAQEEPDDPTGHEEQRCAPKRVSCETSHPSESPARRPSEPVNGWI